jgi:dTDP-4-amino-4,6-dideoxygalactose transaminase
MQELGYNYRLDFKSALGLSQLKRADNGLIRRKERKLIITLSKIMRL